MPHLPRPAADVLLRHVVPLTLVFSVLYAPAETARAERVDPARARKEGTLCWYDIRDIGVEGRGWNETKDFYDRLPARAESIVRKPVWGLSHDSAGMCVRFATGARTIHARWTLRSSSLAMPHMAATGVSGLDLYVRATDGRWHWLAVAKPVKFPDNASRLVVDMLPGRHEYILYLPLYNGVKSVEIGLPREATLWKAEPRRRKPMVFYGTSITQGGCASRTGMVYTAILGRWFDTPVINLGFSGNGVMEPEMADLIAELDASVFVLDCLPNMNASLVAERVEPFVRTLRKVHPDTPILLVEDRSYSNALYVPSARRRNVESRAELRKAYFRLRRAGVRNLYYLPGDKLLGEDLDNLATVDSSHPTDLGFVRQARAFRSALEAILPAGGRIGPASHEWKRTGPDVVVYLPRGLHDGDNEHFLVFEAPGGDELLAIWTQSSVEGHGDNRVVLSRSLDGKLWSDPIVIAGRGPGRKELQASWGFPIVARTGRIYCFFTRELERSGVRQASGAMGCAFSDDNGHTWRRGKDIAVPKTRYDNPDPAVPASWIVCQKPIRDGRGRWIAGVTRVSSPAVVPKPGANWTDHDSRSAFVRFDNIDEGSDPKDLELTWLPERSAGLEVPHKSYPQISVCQEPMVVLLPDRRLFTVMRTMTGHIAYSVSKDGGATWREPEVLRYRDGGDQVENPMAPSPLYALSDGRYLLVFNNNPGRRGKYDQFRKKWAVNQLNFLRHPAWIAVGEFRPDARQPLWFSKPQELLDTAGVPFGPKRTASVAMYPSLTEWHGKRVLWYPDRKYFLLGKYLPDTLLAPLEVPR